jgi:hypothetical protein
MISAPSYIIFLHAVVIVFAFGSFVFAFRLGKEVKKRKGEVSEPWKFFTWGLLLLGIAEAVDIMTPLYTQVFGGINVYSETTEIAALSIIFLGIIGFLRQRLETM